jgi:hypothetical protein
LSHSASPKKNIFSDYTVTSHIKSQLFLILVIKLFYWEWAIYYIRNFVSEER